MVINKNHFIRICGDTDEWDNEIESLYDTVEKNGIKTVSIPMLQVDQHERGYRQLEILVDANGHFGLVFVTSLGGMILHRVNIITLNQAIKIGEEWVMEDKGNREVIISKKLLQEYGNDLLVKLIDSLVDNIFE